MEKLPDLLSQRIREFEQLKATIQEIDKQVKEAGETNLAQAKESIVSQSILTVINLVRKEALDVGEKIGYGNACKDLSTVLRRALEKCEESEASLQLLLKEIDEFISEEKIETPEPDDDPLDLREESESSS